MFNIADYLKKFSHIEGNLSLEREAVSAALASVCGITAPEFEIKKNVVLLKAPPVAKSIVYTRKDALLRSIKEKYPKSSIYDIR